MNAVSLYVTASRMIFQSLNINEPGKWADINRLIIFLRQSLTCCVCGNLLTIPMTSSVSSCQHHICKGCIGGRMRLKPSCSFCKDHSKFVEDTQLRILLQSYRSLCQYVNSTDIPNKWGTMAVSLSNSTNSSTSTFTSNALTSSHGLGALLAGPSNFYQLIEEGANLKDRFSFLPSISSSTTTTGKESTKENIVTNGSSSASSSTTNCNVKTNTNPSTSTSVAKITTGKNKSSSSSNLSANSSVKVTNVSGSTNSTSKAKGGSNQEKSKASVNPRSTQQINSGQVQKAQATNSSQSNQQSVTSLSNKTSTNSTLNSQQDSSTIMDVTPQIASLVNGKSNTVTVVSPSTQIIPDPSSKTGKLLRLPAALSISAIKTTTTNTIGQSTTNPSFVLAKKTTALTQGDKVLTKPDDHSISLSVLPSGQLAIATSSVRSGTSITIPNSTVKMLTTTNSSMPVQQKASTSLPLGFTCVAIDSSGNKVNTTLDQAKVLLTQAKFQVNQVTHNTPVTQSTQQIMTTNSSLKAKSGRRGCRCGLATANPGKLTCCGQRCPCYVDGKGCYDCKCRGCRNPRRANTKSGTTSCSTKEITPNVTSTSSSSSNQLNQLNSNDSSSNVSNIQQQQQQLISVSSSLNLNSSSSHSRSSNNLFLSSDLNLGSPMPVSNGLTLISSSNSNIAANDLLTLPLMEEDSLTTTVDEDKLPYSMIISDD